MTHDNQAFKHSQLLQRIADSLLAFSNDLKTMGLFNNMPIQIAQELLFNFVLSYVGRTLVRQRTILSSNSRKKQLTIKINWLT